MNANRPPPEIFGKAKAEIISGIDQLIGNGCGGYFASAGIDPVPDYPVNFHPGYRLISTLDGWKKIRFAQDKKIVSQALQPGSYIFTVPNVWIFEEWSTVHSTIALVYFPDYIRCLIIKNSGRRLESGKWEVFGPRWIYHTNTSLGNSGYHVLKALSTLRRGDRAHSHLLLALLELTREGVVSDEGEAYRKRDCRWHMLVEFLRENYQEELSRGEAARAIGVHQNHVSRLVQQHARISFVEFVHRIRMEKAEDLLKRTTYSIKEIASMCGFPSSDSFIKVFRKEAGMTPGNFRGINHIIPLESAPAVLGSDPGRSAPRKGYP